MGSESIKSRHTNAKQRDNVSERYAEDGGGCSGLPPNLRLSLTLGAYDLPTGVYEGEP